MIIPINDLECLLETTPRTDLLRKSITDSHIELWLQHKQVTAELRQITGKLNDLIKKYSANERLSWP